MPPELLLTLIISVIAGVGLQGFREYFQQATKEKQNVRLQAEVLLDSLAKDVIVELENDVQRAFDPSIQKASGALGGGFLIQRRETVAGTLTRKISKQTKNQTRLENLYQNWCNWENYGYTFCAFGWIFYAVVIVGNGILALWSIPPNNLITIISIFFILYPILIVSVCYVIALQHKQKFLNGKIDREYTQ